MTELEISDFEVRKLSRTIARPFISHLHYSGGCGIACTAWGLFHSPTNELLGAIAFQTPISENVRDSIFGPVVCDCGADRLNRECNRDDCHLIYPHHHRGEHVTELHRLATKEKCPPNTESWFISRALKRLKEHKPKYWAIISMADSSEGHKGTIYQASNAIYYGKTGKETFYIDENGDLRPPRICGENIYKSEAKERGWEPVKRAAKHRYLFLTPGPYQPESEIRELLRIEPMDYPEYAVGSEGVGWESLPAGAGDD